MFETRINLCYDNTNIYSVFFLFFTLILWNKHKDFDKHMISYYKRYRYEERTYL